MTLQKHCFLNSLFMIFLTVLCSGCGEKKQTLHLYNWGDYLSEDVMLDFEKEFNCIVEQDFFDSNESLYAKLKAGAGGYDLIVPSSYMSKLMYAQKMIDKIDLTKLPNVTENFDGKYTKISLDSEMEYSVPYMISFGGIGYDYTKIKDFKPTWKMYEREDLKGRTSLLDDVRETMAAAFIANGEKSVNVTDQEKIDQAVERINLWKKQIAKFGVDDSLQALASGEFLMVHSYNGDVLQVTMDNPNIRFVIPEEGGTVTFDSFSIPKDSKNKELAYQFINYLYRPDVAAKNMNDLHFVMPHKTALPMVDEELRENPVFQVFNEKDSKSYSIDDLGDENEKYTKAWDKIRSE